MTDTERIEAGALDDALDEWDEYSSDDGAEDEYEDFLDWLNDESRGFRSIERCETAACRGDGAVRTPRLAGYGRLLRRAVDRRCDRAAHRVIQV
jgi:hypothetical protein